MLGVFFSVSIMNQNLTRTTGSLTCVCDLLCMHMHMGPQFTVSSKWLLWGIEFAQNFDSREIARSWHAKPSLKHPRVVNPRLIALNHSFLERMLSLCATDSPHHHSYFAWWWSNQQLKLFWTLKPSGGKQKRTPREVQNWGWKILWVYNYAKSYVKISCC